MNRGLPTRTMLVLASALTATALALPAHSAATTQAGRANTQVVRATDAAADFDSAGGTATCATARTASSYALGLRLVNGCAAASGDVAIARYTFVLPAKLAYSKITLQVLGSSVHVPLQLTAAFHNGDGTLELPGTITVSGRAHIWRSIGSVPAAGHFDGSRVYADVLLDATFGGVNDFDLDRVRLLVSLRG